MSGIVFLERPSPPKARIRSRVPAETCRFPRSASETAIALTPAASAISRIVASS
jgi:hypothetical protein